ncbi:hypothetical protein OAU50_07170 [Planctomycetota bacterium]|nr:hypothetical protein [Planctomycetota bacterium]
MANRTLMLMILGAAVFVQGCGKSDNAVVEPPVVVETKGQRAEKISRAFNSDAEISEASKEIQILFNRLTGNLSKNQRAAFMTRFDLVMFSKEYDRINNKEMSAARRKVFIREMTRAIKNHWFAGPSEMFAWRDAKVIRVESLKPGFVIAYVRHNWDDEGTIRKVRWYLRYDKNQWSFYDLEFMSTNVRISSVIATTVPLNGKLPAWIDVAGNITRARGYTNNEDWRSAQSLLQIRHKDLPATFEAVRLGMLAMCSTQLGKPKVGLEQVQKALKIMPDYTEGRLIRGLVYEELGEYENALKDYNWHLDALGADPNLSLRAGFCYLFLEDKPNALKHFTASHKEFPSLDSLQGLGSSIEGGDYTLLKDEFLKMKDLPEAFTFLTDAYLYDWVDYAAAQAVCEAYESVVGEKFETATVFWQATRAMEDYESARTYAKRRFKLASEDNKDIVRQQYLASMSDAGADLEALKEFEYDLVVFEYLAEINDSAEYVDILRALIDAMKPHSQSFEVLYHDAVCAHLKEHYEKAIELYKTAFIKSDPKSEYYDWYVGRYIRCFIELGKPLDAYGTVKPDRITFDTVAGHLLGKEAAEDLEKLLALHEENAKDDLGSLYYRAELEYLKKNWKQSLSHATELVGKLKKGDRSWREIKIFVHASIQHYNESNEPELMSEALRWSRNWYDDEIKYFNVLILVTWGKVPDAKIAIREYIGGLITDGVEEPDGYVQSLYQNPHIGEQLRSSTYAALHKDYPVQAAE